MSDGMLLISRAHIRGLSGTRRMVIGGERTALTEMPFSATLGTVDPDRIRLLDQRIPLFAQPVVEQGILLVANVTWGALLVVEEKLLCDSTVVSVHSHIKQNGRECSHL